MGWLEAHLDDECCDVATIGRRTGAVHEIEIWFGVVGDSVYVISGNGPGADWYRNALAHPEVVVRFGRERRAGLARAITDPDERRHVGELMGAKYPEWQGDASIGLTRHAWCFEVPLLAIDNWTE